MIATLCLVGIVPMQLMAADSDNQLTVAGKLYYDGQIEQAIALLKPIADKAVAAPPSLAGKTALEYLLDSCIGGFEFSCVNEYWPKYSRLMNALTDVPEQLKLPFGLLPSYYSAAAVWLSGRRPWMEAWLKDWPETEPVVPWAPRDYIRRQLMRAKLYLFLDRTEAARLCVDRALASLASLENPGNLVQVTDWLFDAIDDLLVMGDTERAIGLSLVNERVGQKVFPVNSLEYYRLLRVASLTYEAAGLIPQSKESITRALAALSHVHINPNVQNFYASGAFTFAALISVISNDLVGAERYLDQHPLHSALTDIRSRGVLQALPEVSYLAARALVSTGLGKALDPADLQLLSTSIDVKGQLPWDLIDRAKMYQRLGHAIALLRSDPNVAKAEFRDVAPELIRLDGKVTDAIGFLPRRGLIDQLVLGLTIAAFNEGPLDAKSGDALVKLLDIAARNGQSYSSEAQGLIATARSDEVRADIKESLRVRSRRDASERVDIARVLSSKPTYSPEGQVLNPTIDFKRRNIYSDYGTLIRRITSRLTADQPDLASADAPPSLDQIQRSLRDDEVIVGAPILAGLMGHICITKDHVQFSTSPLDGRALLGDFKILQAALTSQNEPSPELDRQYPVSAARELYDAFILPAQNCIGHRESITWVGSAPENIPFSALLTRGKSEELASQSLAKWPWLLQEHSVSQVGTVAAFVALRRQAEEPTLARNPEFLGVGDPLFGGLKGAPPNSDSYAMRGVVGAGGLSVLPQLPETQAEISDIAALFKDRQTQLLEAGATESVFRRLPLERYSYIEFATHGLVREDISGLTEAALALTPGQTSDPFDDGLLTASEIADLPLKATFVALSACNTALLDYAKYASEVAGLSEAFAIAGVPATLATLWPVNSDASRQIVQGTFQNLIEQGLGPSAALAQAQRRYLADNASFPQQHPRFWAPFVVYGDGVTPSQSRGVSDASEIGNVRLLTQSGGEILSIVEGHAGERLLRAMGDVDNAGRHSALTIKLDGDLGELWHKEDPLIAGSNVALRLDGGWLLGGYHGGGATPTVATMMFLKDDGTIAQQWELSRGVFETLPMQGIRIGPRAALIAFVQHDAHADPKQPWPMDRLVIAELRLGQPLQVRTEFETITQFMPRYVGMESLDGGVLVIVTRDTGTGLPKSHLDDFHQMRPCGLEGHSQLTMLKGESLSKTWQRPLSDVEIAGSFGAADGSVKMVGNVRAGCGEGTRIGLWKVTKGGDLTNLFTDSNPRNAQARALFRRSDGSILLLGVTSRETDVDSFAERDSQQFINKGATNSVNFSTRRVDDAVIITLTPTFKEQSRETLRAGADVWVRGAVSVGSSLWLYGALGNQAAIMQVTHEGSHAF